MLIVISHEMSKTTHFWSRDLGPVAHVSPSSSSLLLSTKGVIRNLQTAKGQLKVSLGALCEGTRGTCR